MPHTPVPTTKHQLATHSLSLPAMLKGGGGNGIDSCDMELKIPVALETGHVLPKMMHG